MNLASVVRRHAEQQGHKTAIRFRDEAISYARLYSEIERLASGLYARGVRCGDRVGLSMSEHPDHLIAHFAIARLNAVIVPMDHRWTEVEKESAAKAFACKIILTDENKLATATHGELPALDKRDSDLLISLSSGTTGKPSGALLTHRNLYERFVSQWRAFGYGGDDCFAVMTPFYFGAGRSFGMSLLAAGGTVLIAPPPLQAVEIADILQQGEVSATFLPPTLLRRLLALHQPGSEALFPDVRYLISSGEPLHAKEAHEVIEKLCPRLYSYYASSEGGGISILHAEEFSEYAHTVGKPIFKAEVEVVDEAGNRAADGQIGRLRYRGPGVSTRLVNSDGTVTDAGQDGWFYPGDLVEQLPTGHLVLRGRDKDVIIRAGINIYPAEIEAALLAHPQITEVAVLGRDDSDRGQVITAYFAGSETIPARELREYCAAMLAPYKIPQHFQQLDKLPKRLSGKIDKTALE